MQRWFPTIAIPMDWDSFCRLPQHPGYRYEYRRGEARLSPRPRHYHALLSLAGDRPQPAAALPPGFSVRPLSNADWDRLPQLFVSAFSDTVPFSLLDRDQRDQAARDCLERTRSGKDGPLVDAACFVATERETPRAALLVTLIPAGDLETFDEPDWNRPPPENALEQQWGRPHLTWIFTHRAQARRGLGSALLNAAVRALTDLGYFELASTFALGNDASILWHWRSGFRLLSHVASPRRRT